MHLRQWDAAFVALKYKKYQNNKHYNEECNYLHDTCTDRKEFFLPRQARDLIMTNYSHVIVQGIEKKYIFEERYLKELYLNLVKSKITGTDIELLGYCVMDNHTHMILYLDDINNSEAIGKFMQKVNTSFAMKYNKMNNRAGFVFRNRYYLQPIRSKRQLRNCLVYIHRNPIKANIVSRYDDYEFSSYKEYKGKYYLLTDRSVELIFGSNKDYLKTFDEIHKVGNIEDIVDVKENIEERIVLKEFLHKYGKSIDEIRKDRVLLKELIIKLKEESGLSLRKMANTLCMSKDRINRVLKG